MKEDSKRIFIPSIQALRVIAATGVFLSHVGFGENYIRQISFSAGVNLFFCISAFLMMYTTEEKKSDHFMRNRLLKLVPLYWILTIITFIASKIIIDLAPESIGIDELIKSLFFVPYSRTGMKTENVIRPIVGPAWTLRFDVWFLFVYTFSMKISHKYRGLISSSICIIFMIVGNWMSTKTAVVEMLGHGFWGNYVIGILIYYIWLNIRSVVVYRRTAKNILTGILFISFIILYSAGKPIGVLSVASGIILLCVLLITENKEMPKFIIEFGKISYSFYLIHYYVIIIISFIVDFSCLSFKTYIGTLGAFFISLSIAYISYNLIERKLGYFLKNLFEKKRMEHT